MLERANQERATRLLSSQSDDNEGGIGQSDGRSDGGPAPQGARE